MSKMAHQGIAGATLLLGVTPEFYPLFDDIVAVDRDANMISAIWPGDTDRKISRCENWMTMHFADNSLASVVGDGGLSMLGDLHVMAALQYRCWQWLKPGGVFVHRIFQCPDTKISMSDIIDRASAPGMSWHAFKLLMMYWVAQQNHGFIPLTEVRNLCNNLFADRHYLSRCTGWSTQDIDTIDLYKDIKSVTFFPTREQMVSTLPTDTVVTWHATSGYDLCETCPVITWIKPQ